MSRIPTVAHEKVEPARRELLDLCKKERGHGLFNYFNRFDNSLRMEPTK
jgi:hypothetical protein